MMTSQSNNPRSGGVWAGIVHAILSHDIKRQERADLLHQLLTELHHSKRRRVSVRAVLDLLLAELPASYYEGHGGKEAA